jgi:hypothetical protein
MQMREAYPKQNISILMVEEEIISETPHMNSMLTSLVVQEDFTALSHHESFVITYSTSRISPINNLFAISYYQYSLNLKT